MSTSNKWYQELNYDVLMQLPSCIFWKDKKGVFLGCNESFARSMGFSSPEEIIGKTDYDLLHSKQESDAYRSDDKAVIETNQPKINYEEDQILPDGSKIVLLTSKVPLLDNDQQTIGVLGVYLDITERKNREKSLQHDKKIAEDKN